MKSLSNQNVFGAYGFLQETGFEEFLDILTQPLDTLAVLNYQDALAFFECGKATGLFVSVFERLLRLWWLDNKAKHELVNHLVKNAEYFGSISYFLKILSIIFQTKEIKISPCLQELNITISGGKSHILDNILTYEKTRSEEKEMKDFHQIDILAQTESLIYGSTDEGGFLRAFLSNFLVLGDFVKINLQIKKE